MKTRIIYPQLWLDEKFAECKLATKLLFMYLISNQYLGLSRYSRISDRKILFDTGLNSVQLAEAKKELSSLRWCFFKDEWIFHNHECAYMDYNQNQRVLISKEKELSSVPSEIVEYFNQFCLNNIQTPLEQGSNLNHKSKIRNQKEGGVGETNTAQKLIDLFNREFKKNYTLTEKRKELIRHRLRTFEFHQLEQAVCNLAQSPFHKGENDRNWVADPDYLFRTDEIVDKALNLSLAQKGGAISIKELMKEGWNA